VAQVSYVSLYVSEWVGYLFELVVPLCCELIKWVWNQERSRNENDSTEDAKHGSNSADHDVDVSNAVANAPSFGRSLTFLASIIFFLAFIASVMVPVPAGIADDACR